MPGTKLELTWPGKNKAFELEPRILIEKPELSYWDPNTENMLIHWDNLLALKALEQNYSWQIKCIYIDPPFNTWAAFEYYDDWIEHTIRLNLMYQRMKILWNLLKEDWWIIFVELDDVEVHYCKVIMDEIFRRDNFICSIAIKSSTPSWLKTAHKNKTIIKQKDFILVYKKWGTLNLNPQYSISNKRDSHYNYYLNKGTLQLSSLKDIIISKWIFDKNIKPDDYNTQDPKFKAFYMENSDSIFQTGKSMPEDARAESLKPENKDKVVPYGNGQFAYNWRRLSPLSSSINEVVSRTEISQEISKLVCDFWDDVDFNNTQNEWWVNFPASKKPEILLMRILRLATNPWDLVLDSFLWSWTTAAVAHKMWRKWIWIELWDHAYSHCKVRLDNVIDGEQGGISPALWRQWWGWYKFYELWPSVLLQDKYWNYIINPNFNSSELVQAICKIENFTYKAYEDNIKHWYSTEKDFIHVTTRHITQEIIKDIQETSLKNWETMLIVAKTFESNLDLPDNIQIKKIPTEILNKCEYNKDNYSLPITKEEIDEE